MSLRPNPATTVPEETAKVARAAFSRGCLLMDVRDGLGSVFDDARFARLFSTRGRPAEAPWRLALITLLQFAADSNGKRPPIPTPKRPVFRSQAGRSSDLKAATVPR
mgnify:CR=1 FL=1|jgi:hypothetical protein